MTEAEREELLLAAVDGARDPSTLPDALIPEFRETAAVVAALRALPDEELPPGWERRLRRRLAAAPAPERPAGGRPPYRRRWRGWVPWTAGAVAALLIVAVVGAGLMRGRGRTPPLTASATSAGPAAGAVIHSPAQPAVSSPQRGASAAAVKGATTAGPSFAAASTNAATTPGIDLAQRKIIKNASMTVQVHDVSKDVRRVADFAAHEKGYVASSALRHQPGGKVRGSVTARVPSDSLSDFVNQVAGLGDVTQQAQSSNDATQRYIDLNGRETALKAEQQAYLNLLKRASSVSDALKVQQALTQVQSQIESLTMEIQSIDRLSTLATVNVTLEPLSSQPALPGGGPFGRRLGQALANSWRVLGAVGSALVVGATWALPWLAIAAVVTAVVLFVLRRRRGGGGVQRPTGGV